MALELITGPTTEPVTLTEMLAHTRIDHADENGLIAGYIISAREHIEGQIKRDLVTKTWDYTIDWAWPTRGRRQFIRLPINPVQSVTSINYVDEAGATVTLNSALYTVLARTNHSYIAPAYDVEWNTTRRVPDAVTVRFVSGYTDCPQDLKQAILFLAAHFYEQREAVRTGVAMTVVPYAVEALISPYRTVTF